MQKNKKWLKVSALALASVLLLTGCDDDIMAKPSNYSDPVITEQQTEEPLDVYGNILETVYDGLRDGSLANDTLDKVLYQYAISVIGRYNKLCDKNTLKDDEITLKMAYADAIALGSTYTTAKKFIEDHKAYWSSEDREAVAADPALQKEELERLKTRWLTIEDRLAASLYDKIKGGAYSERNYFNEYNFYKNIKCSDLAKVNPAASLFYTKAWFNPNIEPEECFKEYLHRENYQYNYKASEDESGSQITYLEDNYIPAIYRQLLVEQYIREEATSAVGRSLARKINVIALNNNAKYDKAAPEVMNYFLKNVITADPLNKNGESITDLKDAANIVSTSEFELFSDVWKGYTANPAAVEILDDLASLGLGVFDKKTVKVGEETFNYYTGTDVDTNVFKPLEDAKKNNDYSTFTNNGAYPASTGVEIKALESQLTDYVTNGWFTRNSDSAVVSKFSETLFNVAIANDLYTTVWNPSTGEDDFTSKNDRFYYDAASTSWKLSRARDDSKYLARIRNSFYLKNTEHEQLADDDCSDVIWYIGGTYYVVQVEYAVSSNKINRTSTIAYDTETREKVVNEVLKVLGKSESYGNLAKKHWLEKMSLQYHDTVVYDYFKANFPELFDD